MEGAGTALSFDKRLVPRHMRWSSAVAFIVGVIGLGIAATKDPAALWGLLFFSATSLLTTTFWSLRTVVTERFIDIKYGLFGPRIPVADVVFADVVDYKWFRFGGFGIRHDIIRGEVAYNMMGDQGRAVKIVYRDGKKTRTVLVSAEHPERLRDAIRSAASGALGAGQDARASVGVADMQRPVLDSTASVAANVGANVAANVEVETVQRR